MRAWVGVMVLMASSAGQLIGQDTETIGDWIHHSSLDPITDEDQSYIWTASSDGSDLSAQVGLGFLCTDQGFGAMVLAGGVTSARFVTVLWRVDSEEPSQEARWSVSKGRNVAVSGPAAKRLASEASEGRERIVVRLSGEISETHVFSPDGLAEVLPRLPCFEEGLPPW